VNLPDLSPILEALGKIPPATLVLAGAAALVAFGAGMAFSRGVMSQLLTMASVALGAGAAWYVFTNRTEVFGASGASLPTEKLLMFSAGAGLITFFVCRVAISLLAAVGLLRLVGGMAGWKGVLVSTVPSGFLLWVSAMTLRLVGNLYGMESAAEVAKRGQQVSIEARSFWSSISKQMDRSPLGGLAAQVDPLDLRATANLARLLILWPEGSVWKKLAQNPRTNKALHHERIQKLGGDPAVRKCIERKDFAGLIQLKQVEQAASHPDLEPVLSGLELEDAMDAIVYKKPSVAKR
jgi:hypothetical protein